MNLVEVEPKRGRGTVNFSFKIIIIILQRALTTNKEKRINFGEKNHERSKRNKVPAMLLTVHDLFVLEGRSWRFLPNMVLTHGQTCICCKVQRKSIGRGQLIFLVFFVHQLKETVKTAKRATKNLQLVLQHCCITGCKTSWIAGFCAFYHLRKKPLQIVSNVSAKTRNIVAAMLQNKLHIFLLPVLPFFVCFDKRFPLLVLSYFLIHLSTWVKTQIPPALDLILLLVTESMIVG